MKKISIIFIALLLFSCANNRKQIDKTNKKVEKKLSKLEQLMQLPKDTILDYYDLSNDSISTFPNLSSYTIKSLNLSHNQLDTVNANYLPKGVVKLNLSHNMLEDRFEFWLNKNENLDWKTQNKLYGKATIKELDISHNKLKNVHIRFRLRRLITSYNDITHIYLSQRNLKYIDISNNPNLSNVVDFNPHKVDTIIRDNIANNKKLIFSVPLKQPITDCFNVNNKL
ncbi:MAG: hypothetical protein KGV44_05365 [Flavobacteriaceae bacterium]|nr:hypothetical protein [Flavobacteriaceae bacterium]